MLLLLLPSGDACLDSIYVFQSSNITLHFTVVYCETGNPFILSTCGQSFVPMSKLLLKMYLWSDVELGSNDLCGSRCKLGVIIMF